MLERIQGRWWWTFVNSVCVFGTPHALGPLLVMPKTYHLVLERLSIIRGPPESPLHVPGPSPPAQRVDEGSGYFCWRASQKGVRKRGTKAFCSTVGSWTLNGSEEETMEGFLVRTDGYALMRMAIK